MGTPLRVRGSGLRSFGESSPKEEIIPVLKKRFCWFELKQTEFDHIDENTLISGKLHIDYRREYHKSTANDKMRAILIQLHANVSVSFHEHVTPTRSLERFISEENILSEEEWPNVYVGGGPDSSMHALPPENMVFPFTIKFGNCLPASCLESGRFVCYVLNAYCLTKEVPGVKSNIIAKKKLTLKFGYYNLELEPWLREPILDRNEITGPSYNGCVEFQVPRTGYVPGEKIPFQINIDGQGLEILHKISIVLLQNITTIGRCRAMESKKSTIKQMTNFDDLFEPSSSQERRIVGSLWIPNGILPSSTHSIHKVEYTLKIEITSQDGNSIYDQELNLKIGTTDGTSHMTPPEGTLPEAASFSEDNTRRRGSLDSLGAGSSMSPKAFYSNLSSRRTSVETLPPEYNELTMFSTFCQINEN